MLIHLYRSVSEDRYAEGCNNKIHINILYIYIYIKDCFGPRALQEKILFLRKFTKTETPLGFGHCERL